MAFVPAGITLISYGAREAKTKATAPDRGVKFIKPAADLKKAIDDFKSGEVERAAEWASQKRGLDKEEAKTILNTYLQIYKKWKPISEETIKGDPDKLIEALEEKVYKAVKAKYVK
jgi:hypothetical protein